MAQKYTVTVKDKDVLDIMNGGRGVNILFAGKTYNGFTLIEEGECKGSYEGYAEGEKVIISEDKLKKIEKEKPSEFSYSDLYIVLDVSPRFQCIVLVTDDRNEALEMVRKDSDHVIVQQSGHEFPKSWRFQ